MISDIRYWEKKASEGHYAIPHFNVWNAEMLMGVIDAAEELRAPIIISFGTGFTGNTSFEDYCYMMESMAKKASVPVILHWDHGRNMTILQNAVDHCMNSVMRDASALPYEQNVAEIKRCVDYFHAYNIPVEAELGHVGNETIYEEALSEYHYTDPKQNPFSFTLFNFLYVLLYNHFQYNAYNRILNHFQRRFEDRCIYSYIFSH